MRRVLGWDVGGANIKAAWWGNGAFRLVERPFALWREPDRLGSVLTELAGGLGEADLIAVTMTAELADCFASRRAGVHYVLDALQEVFPAAELQVWGTDGRFRSTDSARDEPLIVAAANWMATATLVAREVADGIFLDVGTTTTDIVPVVGGRVVAEGRTDPERLALGELVYTGAQRTPVCAIVRSVPVKGGICRVASEVFAIAADVHRWMGRLDEGDYTVDTPDGRGRSRMEAGARLARTICADRDLLGDDEISSIAEHVAGAQVRQIVGGIRQIRRRLGPAAPSTAVVAGSGGFLAMRAAERAGLAIPDLSDDPSAVAARSGPAAAVAYLLVESA